VVEICQKGIRLVQTNKDASDSVVCSMGAKLGQAALSLIYTGFKSNRVK